MQPLSISETNDFLLKDGKPFFYLADTVWVAFANLSIEQWDSYLRFRKAQGFNALQISILPIVNDTSTSEKNLEPFEGGKKGLWNFDMLNPAYFDKAEKMLSMAVNAGFIPVLGVLWHCFVPGTEASRKGWVPAEIPLDAVVAYVQHVSKRFKPYNPIYFISGDTMWETERENKFYRSALEIVRKNCPEALISMHMVPGATLPDYFIKNVDFYMYQSGHGAAQKTPYKLAQECANYPIKRPVLNAEPCYEGHGKGQTLTRFKAFDVRKATWQSLLSGAKVGIAYGGHGIWSSHFRGMTFRNPTWKFTPYEWYQALKLPGAWDVGLAKSLFEAYDLFDLEPIDLLNRNDEEVAVSANADRSKIGLYMPHAYDLELKFNLDGYQCQVFDLEKRVLIVPEIESGYLSMVRMPALNSDALFLARQVALL